MKKILVLLCIGVLFGFNLKAQKKVDVSAEVSYSHALSGKGFGKGLQLQGLYRITRDAKIGFGARLERLEKPEYNTLPIFLATQVGMPFLKQTFVFADLGYSIKSGHFTSGLLADGGIGYFLPLKSGVENGLQCKIYYNYKKFDLDEITNKSRSSIAFAIGYTF